MAKVNTIKFDSVRIVDQNNNDRFDVADTVTVLGVEGSEETQKKIAELCNTLGIQDLAQIKSLKSAAKYYDSITVIPWKQSSQDDDCYSIYDSYECRQKKNACGTFILAHDEMYTDKFLENYENAVKHFAVKAGVVYRQDLVAARAVNLQADQERELRGLLEKFQYSIDHGYVDRIQGDIEEVQCTADAFGISLDETTQLGTRFKELQASSNDHAAILQELFQNFLEEMQSADSGNYMLSGEQSWQDTLVSYARRHKLIDQAFVDQILQAASEVAAHSKAFAGPTRLIDLAEKLAKLGNVPLSAEKIASAREAGFAVIAGNRFASCADLEKKLESYKSKHRIDDHGFIMGAVAACYRKVQQE